MPKVVKRSLTYKQKEILDILVRHKSEWLTLRELFAEMYPTWEYTFNSSRLMYHHMIQLQKSLDRNGIKYNVVQNKRYPNHTGIWRIFECEK